MKKLNVVVIFGGYSSEHEVSKLSASTIISSISEENYNIIPVYITKEGKWLLYDGSIDNIKNIQWERYGTPAVLSPDRIHRGLLRIVGDKVKMIPVDVVFPVLHGVNGEDGSIQGLLELSGIPYVGCGILASAVAMDKAFTKVIVEQLGVAQADHLVFKTEDLEDMSSVIKTIRQKIGYPCFVKPANTGSSVGISKAGNKKALEAAIEKALVHDDKIIVEKEIKGRELECAVLGTGGVDTEASVVGEIQPEAEFYDFDAKYNSDKSQIIVPADIPDHVSDEIRMNAIKIFKAIGGQGLSRVDFFWEEATGKVIFNEINTMPGFTAISLYPRMWNEMGICLQDLTNKLIKIALEMHNYNIE